MEGIFEPIPEANVSITLKVDRKDVINNNLTEIITIIIEYLINS